MLEHEREREQRHLPAVAELLLGQGGDADRVEPAAQVDRGGAGREAAVDRLVEQLAEVAGLVIRDVVDRSSGRNRVPVAGDAALPIADAEGIATRQALHALEIRRLEPRPPMAQVVGDCEPVDRARHTRVPCERLGRCREEEIACVVGVEARMQAVGIAGAEQEVLATVPDDQCEEALDSFEHSFSPAQIGIEDERRVGRCREGEIVEPLVGASGEARRTTL